MTKTKTNEKADERDGMDNDVLGEDGAARLNALFSNKICPLFRAPENLTVAEWADRYRMLSPENSAIPGRWRTDRAPYLEEVMNAFTDPNVKKIVVVASSQVGKTEAELNIIGYMIDQDPGSALFIMPTDQVAKDYSKRRLAPMIRDTPCLRGKVADAKGRDGKNTLYQKSYPGGMLSIFGSNSPANLAGTPARYVFGDEIDRWADSAGKEGDPVQLLDRRMSTFYNAKMVLVSTPTIKGASAIDREFRRGTREYWSAQCPHCGGYHYVNFDSIRFEKHREDVGKDRIWVVDSVEYACPECGCASSERIMKRQPHKWIAENPDAEGTRSFWINGFSSPWTSWEKIVLSYLQAYGDPNELKTVYNTLFGQLWEVRSDVADEDELMARAEPYGAELPNGVLCLTCGVDTQDDRFEYEVVGYGLNGESWGIEYGIVHGRPDSDDTWERLDGVLQRTWHFASGRGLRISGTFVDAGGHYAQEVYQKTTARNGFKVFASRGSNKADAPFTNPATLTNYATVTGATGKAWFFWVGVDAGKAKIMSSLKVKEGANQMHFPSDPGRGYDRRYYEGLLSEYFDLEKLRWEKVPGKRRNEPLDCRNYANAVFKLLNPNLDAIRRKLLEPRGENAARKPVALKKSVGTRAYEDW